MRRRAGTWPMRCGISSCRIATAIRSATSRPSAYDAHDLAPVETTDAVGNTTRAELDYRVLAPRLLTDPNGNRSRGRLRCARPCCRHGRDGQGRTRIWAIRSPDSSPTSRHSGWKPSSTIPVAALWVCFDDATTRIVYDVERYFYSEMPVFAATIARETHFSDLRPGERTGTPAQLRLFRRLRPRDPEQGAGRARSADGGRARRRAHAGSAAAGPSTTTRASRFGQYEPFFSASLRLRDSCAASARFCSTIRSSASSRRCIPNHTYEKVVFDPWQQTTWDVNDTVVSIPNRSRRRRLLRASPESDYLPTWYQQRIDGLEAPRKRPRPKRPQHMPTRPPAYFDTLGRTFLTIADNGVGGHGDADHGTQEACSTGNIRREPCSISKAISAR